MVELVLVVVAVVVMVELVLVVVAVVVMVVMHFTIPFWQRDRRSGECSLA